VNAALVKHLPLTRGTRLQVRLEAFNLFNRANYDVNSILNGEFLSGPTLANPAAAANPNPRFGQYTNTLPPREVQLGARFTF
jgi:hypothetical protein